MPERKYRLPADVVTLVATAKTMAAVLGQETGSPLVDKAAVTLATCRRIVNAHKRLSKSSNRMAQLAWGGVPGLRWAERTLKYNENHDENGRFSSADGPVGGGSISGPKLSLKPKGEGKGKTFIDRVYSERASNPLDPRQVVFQSDDNKGAALFELQPGFYDKDAVHIQWMQAHPSGQGRGSKALAELVAMADKDGITLDLDVWDGGGRPEDLARFYGRHGFEEDEDDSSVMRRTPKTKKYNENHDELGRFAAADGGGGGGSGVGGGERSPARDAANVAAGNEKPLKGLPQKPIKIGGEEFVPGPAADAREAARNYMRSAGLSYNPPDEYVPVDKERAARIAQAFEEMKHDPDDPAVKESYDAMINETMAQWEQIKATGLKVEFIKPGDPDPYAESPRLAIRDIRDNKHMWVFPTAGGFGNDSESAAEARANNPLLRDVGENINGHDAVANDVFRAVHDYFGHYKEGNGFRADGEDNAWRSHVAMYSDKARPAMTSETRGQNSWVNFGPNGEANRTASGGDTIYAPQKIGLLPEWVWSDLSKRKGMDAAVFGKDSPGAGDVHVDAVLGTGAKPKKTKEMQALEAAVFGKYDDDQPRDDEGKWTSGGGGGGGGDDLNSVETRIDELSETLAGDKDNREAKAEMERLLQRHDDLVRSEQSRAVKDPAREAEAERLGRAAAVLRNGRSVGVRARGEEASTRQRDEWAKGGPKDLDAALDMAEESQGQLREFAANIKGATFHDPGVKGRARAQEKIDGGRTAAQITDLARGAFTFDKKESADRIVKALADNFEVADEGWKTTEAGYEDRKVLVRFTNGQVGELQLVRTGMWDAKKSQGQALYTKARSMPEGPERARLVSEMRKLYTAALV